MRQTRRSSTAAVFALAVLALATPPGRPAFAAASDEGQPEPFQRMSPDQVERLLGQPDVHIYDGNSKATYKKGHVPGAVNMYTKDIKPATMPAKKDATLIFYCQNTF